MGKKGKLKRKKNKKFLDKKSVKKFEDETYEQEDKFLENSMSIPLEKNERKKSKYADVLDNEVLPLDDEDELEDEDDLDLEDEDEEEQGDDLSDLNDFFDSAAGQRTEREQVEKWGRNKKTFYGTSYKDYEDDLNEAEAEEEEEQVLLLQQKKAAELTEDDFDVFSKVLLETDKERQQKKQQLFSKTEKTQISNIQDSIKKLEVEQVVRDTSNLSTKEKLDILYNEAPELFSLLELFKYATKEIKKMEGIMRRIKDNQSLLKESGYKYLYTKFHALVVSAMNISFYLLRKSTGQPVRNHAVIKQLLRARKAIEQIQNLDKKWESKISKIYYIIEHPEIDAIDIGSDELFSEENVPSVEEDEEIPESPENEMSEALAALEEFNALSSSISNNDKKRSFETMMDYNSSKRRKIEEEISNSTDQLGNVDESGLLDEDDEALIDGLIDEGLDEENETEITDEENEPNLPVEEDDEPPEELPSKTVLVKSSKPTVPTDQKVVNKEQEHKEKPEQEGTRRKITYKIEKNVGLRKKSKKQYKNPRVKHKVRYKKALIKRASQVGRLRDKSQRYIGEHTGIKSSVVKSIPL